MKAVIDTNVFLAALINRSGAPAKIRQHTKNIKHFPIKSYQGIKIVKVSTFLHTIEKSIQ
jgi:predicted nucleic acid-binding protein